MVIEIEVNDFFVISAIFIVGFLILGVASYGLYFQTTNLEQNVSDLNAAFLVAQSQALNLDAQVTALNNEVSSRDASIAAIKTQLDDMSKENYTLSTNYDIGQQDLNNKIIQLLLQEEDINKLMTDLNNLDSNYIQLQTDFNFLQNNFDANLLVVKQDYNILRDDFKACYWANNCQNDYDACKNETDLNLPALDIELVQHAICDAVSVSDYNTMMSK